MYSSILLLVSVFVGAHSQCGPSITTAEGGTCGILQNPLCSGQLIFEDNFDYLDLGKWSHEITLSGGGNWEFQWYDNNRRNSFTKNGLLYIKPSLTTDEIRNLYADTIDLNRGNSPDTCTDESNWGCKRTGTNTHVVNPVKSAKLRTINSCSFKYGRVEVRAKMPAGDWLWPAIWLLPRHNAYGTWPSSGEIDIVEARGNKNLIHYGRNIGTKLMGSTLHWGPNDGANRFDRTHWEKSNDAGFDVDFHTYEMIWTPDSIEFKVDGETIGTVSPPNGGFGEYGDFGYNPWEGQDKMAPFNQPFYVIINNAVGGIRYFPDDAQNPTSKPWNNNSPRTLSDFWEGRNNWLPSWNLDRSDDSALQVDYVRIYAL